MAGTRVWGCGGGPVLKDHGRREYLEVQYRGGVGRMQGVTGVCNRRRSESDLQLKSEGKVR